MKRLPPIFPRTATLFPYTTRFRSDTGRALRRLVSADLALARSAMGRALAWVAVAIVFGASAWLLVMGVLTALLHSLGLSWLARSEEHTSELQSLMRITYAVFCLKKQNNSQPSTTNKYTTSTN